DEDLVALHVFHEMQQTTAAPLHENGVADNDHSRIDRGERHELAALDPSAHGAAGRPDLHFPTGREFLPGVVHPAHAAARFGPRAARVSEYPDHELNPELLVRTE